MKRKIKYLAEKGHLMFCKDKGVHAKKIKMQQSSNIIEFNSIFSAIEQGYKPCPSCFREYYDIDTATKLYNIIHMR